MIPTKTLIDPKLYIIPTKNLIELKFYMNPTKNLIELKHYNDIYNSDYPFGIFKFFLLFAIVLSVLFRYMNSDYLPLVSSNFSYFWPFNQNSDILKEQTTQWSKVRRVWRYQRGNQNYISKKNRQHNGQKKEEWRYQRAFSIFKLLTFGHCVVCFFYDIYNFDYPFGIFKLFLLLTIVLSVLFRYMNSDYLPLVSSLFLLLAIVLFVLFRYMNSDYLPLVSSNFSYFWSLCWSEEFEDTKGVIRIHISKKNKQHNAQK
jgi:hypothetical protein